jgi:hypothetical protein
MMSPKPQPLVSRPPLGAPIVGEIGTADWQVDG